MTLDRDTVRGIVDHILADPELLDAFRENPADAIRNAAGSEVEIGTKEMEDLVDQVWKRLEKSDTISPIDADDTIIIPPVAGTTVPGTPGPSGPGTPGAPPLP